MLKLGFLSNIALQLSVTALLLMPGCSSIMHDDSGRHEMDEGLVTTREGLEIVDEGLEQSEVGNQGSGMARVDSGMGMMSEGMNRMVRGMDRMPEGMMSGCCQGSEAIMAAMQNAMRQIRDGRALVSDASIDNDAEGIAMMQGGSEAMAAALDNAAQSMNCMRGSSASMM